MGHGGKNAIKWTRLSCRKFRQHECSHEVAEIVGERVELEPDGHVGRGVVLSRSIRLEDVGEQVTRDSDLGHLEDDVALDRSLEGDWPYLWLDATYVKVREAGRIVSVAVTVAVAVNDQGRREVLGMAIGASEAEAFWTEFLRSLVRRGLRGVKLLISDDHKGLKAAATRRHGSNAGVSCCGNERPPVPTHRATRGRCARCRDEGRTAPDRRTD